MIESKFSFKMWGGGIILVDAVRNSALITDSFKVVEEKRRKLVQVVTLSGVTSTGVCVYLSGV